MGLYYTVGGAGQSESGDWGRKPGFKRRVTPLGKRSIIRFSEKTLARSRRKWSGLDMRLWVFDVTVLVVYTHKHHSETVRHSFENWKFVLTRS